MSLGMIIAVSLIVVGLVWKLYIFLEDQHLKTVAKAFEDLTEERRLERQREKYNLK